MRSLPRILQSPTAPDFVTDPFRFYDQIRALGDFVYWEDYGMVMATSHEAVTAVLTHPAMGRELPMSKHASRPGHLSTHNRIDDFSLLRLEPPEHTRLRSVFEMALDDGLVPQMAPELSRICDDLINAFPNDRSFNMQEAYADEVPAITVMRFLGLPDDMSTAVQGWARDIDALMHANRDRTQEDAVERATVEFHEYMSAYLSDRRLSGEKDDFVGRILGEQKSEKTLTDDEIISLVLLFVKAGTGGTAYTMGNAIFHLARYSERKLAMSADLIAQTVEECVRMEPPLHIVGRHAQEEVSVLGQVFQREEQIGCLLASACHDDAVWPDGNTFDPFRASRRHTAFGVGIHACVGGSLARMMMKIALPVLFARCPNLRLTTEPTYANDYLFRRIETLAVEV